MSMEEKNLWGGTGQKCVHFLVQPTPKGGGAWRKSTVVLGMVRKNKRKIGI
jgi:hypothetical protein